MDQLKDLVGGQGGDDQQQGGQGGGGALEGAMEDKVIDQSAFPSLFSPILDALWLICTVSFLEVDQEAGDLGIPSSADGTINKEVNEEAQKFI